MANMASACALVLSSDKTLNPLRTWRTREAASTCVLVSISVVCICILVVCGVFVVREYSLAVGYESTVCHVHNVTYATPVPCQHCPGHRDKSKDRSAGSCVQSFFPCVQIVVSYSVSRIVREGLLHADSIESAGAHSQCSFHVCQKDPEENKRQVESYASQWLVHNHSPKPDSFTCHYNTANYNDVIIHKRYSKADVVHSMLWPSLVLISCCVVFLSLETRRRKLTFCGRRTTGSECSPDRRNTPEVSDARLLDSQVILRRNLIQNGLLDDGRIVCKLAANSDAMSCKAWKSYSSLEKLVTRKEEFPLRGGGGGGCHPSADRLDCSKSRSFDRLDESRRLHNRIRADMENDRMRRIHGHGHGGHGHGGTVENASRPSLPHSLDSIVAPPLQLHVGSTTTPVA